MTVQLKFDKNNPGYRMVLSSRYHIFVNYTIKLPNTVTLGGAYDGGRASPIGQLGDVICCRGALGLQQRRRTLFARKIEVAA